MSDPFDEWLASRPECVRKLADRYPIGTTFDLDGELHYLLGYTENDMLIVSLIDPSEDYDGANENKRYVCAKHFESPGVSNGTSKFEDGTVLEWQSIDVTGDAALEMLGLKGTWVEEVLKENRDE